MAFAVIPWTLIFASRVSPLPLLTGVSAEKLQVYHQYGARILRKCRTSDQTFSGTWLIRGNSLFALVFMSVVHTIPFSESLLIGA